VITNLLMPTESKVLLIGNGVDPSGNLRQFLRSAGLEIASAATALEGEELWRRLEPDVALIEYELPDRNAIDLLATLKAISSSTPIIILSGLAFTDMSAEAVKAGAEHFLNKSARPEALLTIIERCLDNRRIRRVFSPENLRLEELQRQYIEEVLYQENGRVEAAAKRLGIPRSSLYHKLKRYRMAGQRRRAG